MNVYVTGLGCISSVGNTLKNTLDSFQSGYVNSGAVSVFKTELSKPVFEVKISDDYLNHNKMRTYALAEYAVNEALSDALLTIETLSRFRVGICLGTTVASQLNDLEYYKAYRETGIGTLATIERYYNGNLAAAFAAKYNLSGPALTVVNACSSATDAIGTALSWINNNLCDIVIAGGADELNLIPYAGFNSLGIMSEHTCRPFDKDRTGLNLGEGAGIAIIEKEESLKRRCFKSHIKVSGYGTFADAYHLTAPRPDGSGLKNAINYALKMAGANVENIAFINAHGTATPDNDKVEAKVFKEVFGNKIKFLSTKGYTGHTLGAAGGLEAVFTCSALAEGWIPASAGFKNFDEEVGLMPVTEITSVKGNYAVSTSLAFGGNNSALVFEKIK